ncbi:effector-binding domain-containing protein [Dethiosulfatibacter aminovorans DSM 17477]|uniref:Effector-binding domain-containing protein n=1 Tax=Dethiosulfatibacter aminovorans DSM 17477 TaxID=1121476 RepID=A0A1M6JUA0_9FIRM|nr:GyrI-like domain-containing protein [Dethiosulfatibacter aminovorans]SHJ50246.1 effector-binding domain-containing protein [Dethiosulfatibacter aminovorans DSM 17477]
MSNKSMSYKCEVVEQEAQKTLAIRTRSSMDELPKAIGMSYKKIYEYISETVPEFDTVPYVGYFNMDLNDLDVEIGVPVDKDFDEREDMKMSEIPAGKYATTLHVGPYSDLKVAYEVLMKWIEGQDLEVTGIGYEYYLNDPQITPPEDLETEILFQLK